MYTYAKFDQNSPCGSRVMRISGPTEAKPRHRFAYQWLDNIKINKFAKFNPNIPCGSRVISILTNTHISRALVCDFPALMANKGFFHKLFQIATGESPLIFSYLYFIIWLPMVSNMTLDPKVKVKYT